MEPGYYKINIPHKECVKCKWIAPALTDTGTAGFMMELNDGRTAVAHLGSAANFSRFIDNCLAVLTEMNNEVFKEEVKKQRQRNHNLDS